FYARDPAAVRAALAGLEARPPGWVLTQRVVALLQGMLHLLADELETAAGILDGGGWNDVAFEERWPAVLRAEIDFSLGHVADAAKRVEEIARVLAGTELHLFRARAGLLAAHLARARSEPQAAEAHAHRALADAWAREMWLVTTDALEMLAILDADRSAIAESARLLG